jgi:hypothetical protein
MSEYTKADILQWMLGAFEVDHRQGNELKFPCPTCGHEAFYFNIKKVLGYCHRAGCHTTLNLEQTINIVGYGPELAGYVPGMEKKERKVVEVTLPPRAAKIEEGSEAAEAMALRGVTYDMIRKWDMHCNQSHIIVPIYEDGKLVQYNSRRVNIGVPYDRWFSAIDPDALRYKYASGVPITNFILGWEECKLWDEVTFVENTFVSMWLRDLGVTTNFGSYLSPRQVDMLVHSRVKRVTFLWDEGANSQKAERMLKKVGISARSIYIKGQPDDHTYDEIKELLSAEV